MGTTTFGRAARRKAGPADPAAVATKTVTRRESRRRTVLTGMLASRRNAYTINCIIMDLSKSGARVRVERGAAVGGDVVLVHLRDKIAFETRVVWRRGHDIGLEFRRAHDLNQATTTEMDALRRHCVDFRPTLICLGDAKGRFRQ